MFKLVARRSAFGLVCLGIAAPTRFRVAVLFYHFLQVATIAALTSKHWSTSAIFIVKLLLKSLLVVKSLLLGGQCDQQPSLKTGVDFVAGGAEEHEAHHVFRDHCVVQPVPRVRRLFHRLGKEVSGKVGIATGAKVVTGLVIQSRHSTLVHLG